MESVTCVQPPQSQPWPVWACSSPWPRALPPSGAHRRRRKRRPRMRRPGSSPPRRRSSRTLDEAGQDQGPVSLRQSAEGALVQPPHRHLQARGVAPGRPHAAAAGRRHGPPLHRVQSGRLPEGRRDHARRRGPAGPVGAGGAAAPGGRRDDSARTSTTSPSWARRPSAPRGCCSSADITSAINLTLAGRQATLAPSLPRPNPRATRSRAAPFGPWATRTTARSR